MTLPNFFIIGAGKAGTTSLYYYLDGHPDVYMSPIKEPNFFALEGGRPDYRGPDDEERINRRSITDLDGYEALFAAASGEKAIGEASPMYLRSEKAPKGIKRRVPEARLIAILRDPAERAYSAYLNQRRDGREPLGFADALEAEAERGRNNWAPGWQYRLGGFYHAQLSRYYDLFGREQIRVYLYEELKADPLGMVRDVFGFLGVDDSFAPDTSLKHNVSGIPSSRLLHAFFKRPNPAKAALKPFFPKKVRRRLSMGAQNRNLQKAPPLDPETRRTLVEAYREDILKLQGLIGQDLSAWLGEKA